MTMDKLFDGSDAHLLPGNAELIEPPHEIICFALKVGDWFKERDITHWKIADCASRNALEAADKRIAEMEADLHNTHARVMQNGKAVHEAERKLAVADKRIAEEREAYDRLLEEGANKLYEAERKYLDSVEVNTALQHGLYEIERERTNLRKAFEAGINDEKK